MPCIVNVDPPPPCLLTKASSQREVMIASCFTNMFAVFMMALADSQWMLFLGVLPRSRHPFRPISSPVACASNVSSFLVATMLHDSHRVPSIQNFLLRA